MKVLSHGFNEGPLAVPGKNYHAPSVLAFFPSVSRLVRALTGVAAGCALAGLLAVSGVELALSPQGALQITALAQSDTIVSIPYHRAAVFSGVVASVSGSTVTMEVIAGAPNWTANELVYGGASQPNTYYLLVGTGAREGMYYTITGNATNTVTVDLAGDDLAAHLQPDDEVHIIPYWTFGTLFGGSLAGTTSPTGVGAPFTLLLFGPNPGINLSSTDSYYRYTGTSFGGPGWRRKGTSPNIIKDNDILAPDNYFIVRNSSQTNQNISISGYVQMVSFRSVVGNLAMNQAQDNLVGITVPIQVSLQDAGLITSGVLAPTTSPTGVNADVVLQFDNSVPGFNKSSIASYYYYSGASFGGPGWRKKGVSPTIIQNSNQVFQPGQGYILRRQARPQATADLWKLVPAYLN